MENKLSWLKIQQGEKLIKENNAHIKQEPNKISMINYKRE